MPIFKYSIEPRRTSELLLPAGAKILKIGIQANPLATSEPMGNHPSHIPVLWADVDETNYLVPVRIRSLATGDALSDQEQAEFLYVDTIQLPGRNVVEAVFHVYVSPVVLPPIRIARPAAAAQCTARCSC